MGEPIMENGRLTGDARLKIEDVQPEPGRMVVFYHRTMHEGLPAALKYIIRTDVLYERRPAICTEPQDVIAFDEYERAQLLAETGKNQEAMQLFRRCFKRSPALAKIYGQQIR